MSGAPSLRSTLRIGTTVAGAHFLGFHTYFGLLLIAPRDVANLLSLGLLPLIAPAALFPIDRGRSLAFFAPPASMIPVALASIGWALVICAIWLLAHRFVRYRFSTRACNLWRRFGLAFAFVTITWLFFGPVFGFAGDVMFGVLDPARIMDGRFRLHPSRLAISAGAWAACVFAACRFLIVAPSTRELTPTV